LLDVAQPRIARRLPTCSFAAAASASGTAASYRTRRHAHGLPFGRHGRVDGYMAQNRQWWSSGRVSAPCALQGCKNRLDALSPVVSPTCLHGTCDRAPATRQAPGTRCRRAVCIQAECAPGSASGKDIAIVQYNAARGGPRALDHTACVPRMWLTPGVCDPSSLARCATRPATGWASHTPSRNPPSALPTCWGQALNRRPHTPESAPPDSLCIPNTRARKDLVHASPRTQRSRRPDPSPPFTLSDRANVAPPLHGWPETSFRHGPRTRAGQAAFAPFNTARPHLRLNATAGIAGHATSTSGLPTTHLPTPAEPEMKSHPTARRRRTMS